MVTATLNARFGFLSDLAGDDRVGGRKYAATWAKSADPDSPFGKKIQPYRHLPDETVVDICLKDNHDARYMFDEESGHIIGHTFFQRHADDGGWYGIYSVFVEPSLRRQGYGTKMVADCLIQAHDARMTYAMVGDNGDPYVNEIWWKFVGPARERLKLLRFHVHYGERIGMVMLFPQ